MFNHAKGISIELGLNSRSWPSLLIYRQKSGRIRAKVPEHHLNQWYNDDDLKTAKWFGLKIDFSLGRWKWPEPKYWKMPDSNAEEWGRDSWPPSAWNSGDHWFVFDSRIPLPGIFISCFIRVFGHTPGFYLGFKTYRVDQQSSQLKDKDGNFIYENGEPVYTWANVNEQHNVYLCFSASLRDDLID
jgi:hypothetical protein